MDFTDEPTRRHRAIQFQLEELRRLIRRDEQLRAESLQIMAQVDTVLATIREHEQSLCETLVGGA